MWCRVSAPCLLESTAEPHLHGPAVRLRSSGLWRGALVVVPMGVQVTRLVAGVVMVLTRLLRHALVPVAVLVEVAGLVAGMVVVLTRLFLRHGLSPHLGC